ncbi:asparagine synthase-related protein [Thermoactinomyces mirandus]|nr:asparagine synthase-related protein [Thermoactinomyces mirandus]
MDRSISVFSVGYPILTEDDERKYACRMTQEVGGEFHSVTIASKEVPELLRDVNWHLDEPRAHSIQARKINIFIPNGF